MRNAAITGWGKALPPNVLSNADLEQIVDTDDEWITSRTGIKERRISHVEVGEMAAVAGAHALAAAGLEPGDIDLIITATCTPETLIPPTAALVQHRLGALGSGAFDLNANCSGFLYGYVNADAMIKTGAVDRVLLIGVEKLSFVMDWTDRGTCVLFGDGAGAVVIEATDADVGLRASVLGNDGSAGELLCVPQFGTSGVPGDRQAEKMGIRMSGPDVFRRAVTAMGDSAATVVSEAGWELEDIDLLIPHQANQRIIDATARRLSLDPAKVFVNIHGYGNTSAATIPIALTEALEEGRVRPGANLVFAAFGGGLSWGAFSLKFGDRVHPLGTSDAAISPPTEDVWTLLEPHFAYYGAERE